MTIATPMSAGRFCNSRIYASRPPADPPTQTIGKFFTVGPDLVSIYLLLQIFNLRDGLSLERSGVARRQARQFLDHERPIVLRCECFCCPRHRSDAFGLLLIRGMHDQETASILRPRPVYLDEIEFIAE